MDQSGAVYLNVGGNFYTTTREVLKCDQESVIGKMFSQNPSKWTIDRNGNVFIDRDGSLFRYILNFLRVGALIVPTNFPELDMLLEEARFYEMKKLEEEIMQLREYFSNSISLILIMPQVVQLNVGGSLYTTSRSVLTKDAGSKLYHMLSGNMPNMVDTNGNVFIDRDGKLFRYILNFLRDNKLVVPLKFAEFDLLLAEAEYYQLKQLKEAILEKMISNVDIMEFVMIQCDTRTGAYEVKATKTTVFALYKKFGKDLHWHPRVETLSDVISFKDLDHDFISHL
ncbi:uncharacterized protein [Apostichopus japonicus]|uniref:uncharacterized protein n=1 Tax=Stichopus japonicus TaxID=307972 RepID=UPI003AB7B633